MAQLAISVVGPDRPGIIADLTGALAGAGANLEDSTMTLLRGHFAMMLIAPDQTRRQSSRPSRRWRGSC